MLLTDFRNGSLAFAGESAYGTMNIGAAWKFADNVAVLAGYDAFTNSDLPDTFTLQVDIDFNLYAAKH